MKPLVIRSAVVASLGGLIFGFDTAVISGAEEQIQQVFALSDAALGWIVTTALIGTIIGALTAGTPADRLGRKKMLFFIGLLYVVGAVGSAFAPNVFWLQVFRFLGGLGVGMSSVVAPIYTAEVAPPTHRGRLVGLVQFNIVLGILVAYLSNFVIRAIMPDSPDMWRWMLGVMTLPAVVFVLLLLAVPETPRWLASAGRTEQARTVSRRLCATDAESDAQMSEIEAALAADRRFDAKKVAFFTKANMKVIWLAIAIAFFNQMSGINAILYYAPRVMKEAGAADNAAYLMSVAVGVMNLIATMTALTVIDKIGRRRLMIYGSIGYLVSLGFLTGVMFYYESRGFTGTSSILVLIGLLVFIAAHAFGQGSVIWVFISEIFPNRIRGRGQSLGSLTHWVFAAITTFAFPPIIGALGGGVAFLIFFVAMVGQLIWVLKVMPETKGVPLEELGAELGLTLDREPGPAPIGH